MFALSGLVRGGETGVYGPRGGSTQLASGVLGAVIVGSIAVAAGQAGVARALSLVIAAQLIAGLVLDALGVFGAGADFSVLKALGVVLIIAGGVLVVSYLEQRATPFGLRLSAGHPGLSRKSRAD